MQDSPAKSPHSIQELEYIVSNIPDLLIRIDIEGRIRFINAASILFFNRLPGQLIGKNIGDLIQVQGVAPLDKTLTERICNSRQAEIIEGELVDPLGLCKHIEIRILPEPNGQNQPPHLVLMVRDVTLRKEAERKLALAKKKAEQNDLLKTAFLANMSHEIRTPLNAIVGFSQIILDEGITRSEQERFYEYINQNSNQLIALVNDIIDLSKLESNQLVIRNSAVNLNTLVDELLGMVENEKINREKLHLMIIPSKEFSDEDAIVLIDHYRLKQVLSNLLINAIKFTPKGFIQFGYQLNDDKNLLFYVRDTGIGIPKNKQEEVFQYFQQLENTLNRDNMGSGLGLAICKRLVELMGGTLWLQSEKGNGTTFFFTIPYRKA